MTDDLLDLFPNASADFRARNTEFRVQEERPGRETRDPSPVRPKLERRSTAPAVGKKKSQAGDTRRFLVRVTSFRRRLIDEDNLCEKFVVDCCRYSGGIPEDGPGKTKIEVCQVKVGDEGQEQTLVEIFGINPPP